MNFILVLALLASLVTSNNYFNNKMHCEHVPENESLVRALPTEKTMELYARTREIAFRAKQELDKKHPDWKIKFFIMDPGKTTACFVNMYNKRHDSTR